MNISMQSDIPLRARKKAKVRAALLSTSFRLFRKHGYSETTLEDICKECDIAVQTLLRYFGSKDDLLFAAHPELLRKFAKGVARAAKRKGSIAYWAKFLHSNCLMIRDDPRVRETYRIIVSAPSLLARLRVITREYESLVEQALCEEPGSKVGKDLYSTLLARLVVTSPVEEALRMLANDELQDMVEYCDAIIPYVLENFPRPTGASALLAPSAKRKLRAKAR